MICAFQFKIVKWNPSNLTDSTMLDDLRKEMHNDAKQRAADSTGGDKEEGDEEKELSASSSDKLLEADAAKRARYAAIVKAGSIEISCTDSGPGLTEENIAQLFGEGAQFNPNELQAGQGSGLALWITKGIVQLHQGQLRASSKGPGQGSTFVVELPVVCDFDGLSHSNDNQEDKMNDNMNQMNRNNSGIGISRNIQNASSRALKQEMSFSSAMSLVQNDNEGRANSSTGKISASAGIKAAGANFFADGNEEFPNSDQFDRERWAGLLSIKSVSTLFFTF